MDIFFEVIIVVILIAIQSVFGVGLLLFGTPSFLLFGYDFANTINILMPISITISSLQFFKSNVSDKKFLSELGDPYDILMLDPNGRAAIDLGLYGVPETYFIDSKGKIKYRQVGPLTVKKFENILKSLKVN